MAADRLLFGKTDAAVLEWREYRGCDIVVVHVQFALTVEPGCQKFSGLDGHRRQFGATLGRNNAISRKWTSKIPVSIMSHNQSSASIFDIIEK